VKNDLMGGYIMIHELVQFLVEVEYHHDGHDHDHAEEKGTQKLGNDVRIQSFQPKKTFNLWNVGFRIMTPVFSEQFFQ
jgi:hypothetical protein